MSNVTELHIDFFLILDISKLGLNLLFNIY